MEGSVQPHVPTSAVEIPVGETEPHREAMTCPGSLIEGGPGLGLKGGM